MTSIKYSLVQVYGFFLHYNNGTELEEIIEGQSGKRTQRIKIIIYPNGTWVYLCGKFSSANRETRKYFERLSDGSLKKTRSTINEGIQSYHYHKIKPSRV